MTHAPSELNGCIEQAVYAHTGSLVRVAYTYVKSIPEAEDIVQDTFLTYLKCKKRFVSKEHEKAWLIRVCINKAKNVLKSGRFSRNVPIEENSMPSLDEPEFFVLEAVMQLEEKYRLPIHLYYYEGYTIKEIATLLSLPSASVGTRLARAKAQLKNKLGGAFDEE